MGSDRHYPEEGPAHGSAVDGFWMETHQVTNAQFAAVRPGHRLCDRGRATAGPADFPGAPAENLQPGSMVFTGTAGPVDLRHLNLWWTWTPGRVAGGIPRAGVVARPAASDHPVVHVAYEDAEAYAAWAGAALPTEAEWEAAARGGLEHKPRTPGATTPEPTDQRLANYWHGEFPWRPDARLRRDHAGRARSRPTPTACSTWPATSGSGPRLVRRPAPRRRHERRAASPAIPGARRRRGQLRPAAAAVPGARARWSRAGRSCARTATAGGTDPAARRPQMIDTGMSHIGFRCVKRI